ncbi:tetratricopeptide repeat protein [Flavobacterium sp. M31R6]|uniref:tetratricopeptide repeat protein n=1 Tax=Flavobacterium sp. M31R6 TaxID=2739062 RepID=UPI00156A4DD6|nr:tetratricopeptide repeat protein [Flavobacterium sp. M31R6]QKJ62908.1 tetratricopeptide repeat protein [Flavobacterium sp. M31R6]
MRKLPGLFLFLFTVQITSLYSQESTIYTYPLKDFDKALSLYEDKQYASAQIIFKNVQDVATTEGLRSDCAYYIANCAIRTDQDNAEELINRFVEEYPASRKQNQAFIDVAYYYFDHRDYKEALLWFNRVDESVLKDSERNKYNFQKGYAYFDSKKTKEAQKYFSKVANTDEYGTQSKYYMGFMAYESDDYVEANKQFDQVSGNEKYSEKLSYYKSDMSFKSGDFQKAIDLGIKAMPNSTPEEKSELNKIIGESYFNLKQYDKAIPYLVGYKGKKGKWNNTDFYQLGYAYYVQKDYENAISQFNKIIDGNDFIAQNAYYHLGESYLESGKKQQALNAFKNASEMNFNLKLQEDASFNYAKLSYEIGNSYQSVPEVLLGFINKYPTNPNNDVIEKLLIDSYISSKNYKEALVLLEKNKTPENRIAYQKVVFYRGLELYNEGNYTESLSMFEKAIKEQKDPTITARASFWKAESEYNLEDYKEALLSYQQFSDLAKAKETVEFKNINYNIAYANFKLKEYEAAGNSFQSQIDNNKADKFRLNDSYLRLADCRFVTTKYQSALDAYIKVIESKSVDADYAYFQKALCYGFLSKNSKKIEELNAFLTLYPKSDYQDDALFELGNTYVADNKQDLAIKTYDKLATTFKNSSYTSRAVLREGLVYYNSDRDDLALAKFKKVATDFPKTPEAYEAVATARLIYVDNGKVDEYATWVRTLDFVAVTDLDLDNDTFEAAEKQFEQANTKQAISGYASYVSKFPNGVHILKANFQLAQLLYSEGSESKSVSNYEYVISQPRCEYTEQSLVRLAQIFLKDKNCDKGIPVLVRIENEADFPQNKTFAQANLMKCYYETKDYSNSVIYADKVLANPKAEENVKSDAQIIVARSAMQSGDEAKAKVAYAKLLSVSKGELAAEALYYDAYFKNKDGKFEISNIAIQKLAKNYSSYRYFGAKGLVLMAKNYYGLKDSYQATYVLDNVIENFTDYSDVVEEAKTELNRIKTEEAKTNSSITK